MNFGGSTALCAKVLHEPMPHFRHVETDSAFAQLQMRATLCNEVVDRADGHLHHLRHVTLTAETWNRRQMYLIAGGGFQRN